MRSQVGTSQVTQFDSPKHVLAELSAEANAALLSAAADLVLVVDGQGVVEEVSSKADALPVKGGVRSWVGKSWEDTVASESRAKVVKLLNSGSDNRAPWRQVNVLADDGTYIPISFCAISVGPNGRMIALGRDLRAQSEIQQQLVNAQQTMERDYLRLRHLESRYRILFDLTSEGVLVVDGKSQKIIEANPAAAEAFGDTVRRMVGKQMIDCIDSDSRSVIGKLLDTVRGGGKSDQAVAKIRNRPVTVSVSVMHEEGGEVLLVRVRHELAVRTDNSSATQAEMVTRVIEQAPDAFVVTDTDGDVLAANLAFTEMVEMNRADQIVGESLDRWLGRAGVDLNVLLANLRQRSSVRLFATTMRNENGRQIPVEISAVAVTQQGSSGALGFTIRDVGRRGGSETRNAMPHSVEQLTELVGRVPLREIVGETTDLIEKLCIEAALLLTQDNRATASEILGLSRQSLYVKLRQHGIGNLGGDDK
ncbi:PpsR-CrtJ, transcriptional regulator PpsR [Oxalobacteraceae bacterium]